jgi:3',5'-cyclic AMP phosphodiesterase CpdA
MNSYSTESTPHKASRRHWLQAAAATVVGAGAMSRVASAESPPATNRQRVLRLAHLTDIHVQPELDAERGMAACLHHVQSLADAPQLILTGGDSVMDVMGHDLARGKVQADIWRRTLDNECSLPVISCIGNHDVWGWNKPASRTTGDEPNWGKAWGEDLLRLDNRYYHTDRAGWRVVVLDSTYPAGNGYTAKLDDQQFDWLANVLGETPATTPVLVLSHIPILSVAAYLDGNNEKSGNWQVPGSWMHIDARRIKDLFGKHPNVKVCLSGHLHLVDQVTYNGVTYCCNGAVCGAWWKGNYHECQPGYGVVDLFDDGTFANQYVTFPWQAS